MDNIFKMNASEAYTWVYSFRKEMDNPSWDIIKIRGLIYDTAISNYCKGKLPTIFMIDDAFLKIPKFEMDFTIDGFILYLNDIKETFPYLGQLISELFDVRLQVVSGGVQNGCVR